jgi:hypothetical protein
MLPTPRTRASSPRSMRKTTLIIGKGDEAQRKRVLGLIVALSLAKNSWRVTVERNVHKRTQSQNGLYQMWLDVIATHTGHSSTELAEAYKQMFLLPQLVDMGDGGEVEIRPSTTKLNVAEMSEYMDRIYAHATGELGCLLPLPEEQHNANA